MTRPYKARNKQIIMRQGNGRFRRATGADIGIGGVCPECGHFLLQHYDGNPSDRPRNPALLRYRCFTCEPETEGELAQKPVQTRKSGFVEAIEEAASTKQPAN